MTQKFFAAFFQKSSAFFLCLALLLPLSPACAEPPPITVPITQSVLPDGDIRYAVPVSVGNSTAMPALLDTGSTGLRVMRSALTGVRFTDTGLASLYEFAGGDRLTGTIGTATLAVGPVATDAPAPFELIAQTGCAAFQPQCGAALLPAGEYGIGGDGIAGQGFQAILGAGLAPAGGAGYAENPLALAGARRWIIHVPEPGQDAVGALTLNPGPADLQGFQLFKLARAAAPGPAQAWVDELPACLSNTASGAQICGPASLDTGSPGVVAVTPGGAAAPLWPAGDPARLTFAQTGFSFAADRGAGTGLLAAPLQGTDARLIAGFLPFLYFDVLYDAANGEIGLRPRADAPNPAATPAPGDQPLQVIELNTPPPGAPAMAKVITP